MLLQLRTYCLDINKTKIAEEIHLFLVPNYHINPMNIEPTYILDFELRNPQFTSILTSSNGIPYFYMKFDCFHCVLPLSFEKDIKFTHDSCFNNRSLSSYELPGRSRAISIFPDELLQYNISQIGHRLSQIVYLGIPSNIHCIITQGFKSQIQAPKRKLKYPSQPKQPVWYIKDYSQEENETVYKDSIVKAHEFSPLRKHITELTWLCTAQLRNENTQLREENVKLREENAELRKQLETFQPPVTTEDVTGTEITPVQPSDS